MNEQFDKQGFNRRQLGRISAGAVMGGLAFSAQGRVAANTWGGLWAKPAARKFTMDLCPGRIGVKSDQVQTIQLAAQFGFESVEPNGGYLAGLGTEQLADVKAMLQQNNLVWGAAGLPVDFRHEQAAFEADLVKLQKIASGLQRAGVTRVGTWISPAHNELTYLKNFRRHTTRLRKVAEVLAGSGLRLGLEYVGPRKSWATKRYAFVHSLEETMELLAEIGKESVGVVLDSWHWYTAEEAKSDLESLTADEIVAVDLNDAPDGIDVRDQIDNRRELPTATGVIDLEAFLSVLIKIGYDGPVRAEPFNRPLEALENEPAVKATAQAMRNAFALVGG